MSKLKGLGLFLAPILLVLGISYATGPSIRTQLNNVSQFVTSITGDATAAIANGVATLTLATVNSNVGSCGDATHSPQITLNGKGLATACSPVSITGTAPGGSAGGDLTGTYPNPTLTATQNNVTAFTQLLTDWGKITTYGISSSSSPIDNISSNTVAGIGFTINLSTQAPQQAWVLTGSPTAAFSNKTAGANTCIELIQDGTGSRTVTWPSGICWQGGGATRCAGSAPTLSTGKGVHDLICFRVEGDGNTVDGSYTLGF